MYIRYFDSDFSKHTVEWGKEEENHRVKTNILTYPYTERLELFVNVGTPMETIPTDICFRKIRSNFIILVI